MEISNQTFRAKHLAVTKNKFKNVTTKIDLYELTSKDKKFLEKLKDSVDFDKSLRDMPEFDRKRWQKVFNYAVESAQNSDSRAYLAMSNSRPCGILSFFDDIKSFYLDAICDIPQPNGKRVNYTGSTLFYQMFKLAEELKIKLIKLSAVIDGPIDVVSKYKEKGFKEIGMDDEYVKMSCNKYEIKEQLKKLSSNIQYKTLNSENKNLEDLII